MVKMLTLHSFVARRVGVAQVEMRNQSNGIAQTIAGAFDAAVEV